MFACLAQELTRIGMSYSSGVWVAEYEEASGGQGFLTAAFFEAAEGKNGTKVHVGSIVGVRFW